MKAYEPTSIRTSLDSAWKFVVIPCHTADAHFYKREDTGRLAASVTTKLSFVAKPYLQTWYVTKAIDHVHENLDRLLAGDKGVLTEAGSAAVRSRDRSADIGTSAHDAFDKNLTRWLQGGTRPDSAVTDINALCQEKGVEPRGEEIAACRSYDKFLDENEIIPLASEIRVWYEEGKDCYAGSVDAVFLNLTVHKGREGDKDHAHDYTAQAGGIWWCACGRETEPKLILNDWKTSNTIRGKDDYALQSVAYAQAIEKATGLKFDGIWVIRFNKKYADYEICAVTDRKSAWKEFISISRAFDAKNERTVRPSLLEPLKTKQVFSLYDSTS